jgi:hypothetical protein
MYAEPIKPIKPYMHTIFITANMYVQILKCQNDTFIVSRIAPTLMLYEKIFKENGQVKPVQSSV